MEVDTYQTVSRGLPWSERVARAAKIALSDFDELRTNCDFLAEGRNAFAEELEKWEVKGGDPAAAMCFVWYVTTLADEARAAPT